MEDGVDKSKNRAETRADELQLFDVHDNSAEDERMSQCGNCLGSGAVKPYPRVEVLVRKLGKSRPEGIAQEAHDA